MLYWVSFFRPLVSGVLDRLDAEEGSRRRIAPDWPYPSGDVWFLRYRGSELDDGVDCTTGGPACVTEANLDSFVNGEAISNHDVVVWYAGHVTHDVAHEEPGEFGHICGPDLKPVNW